VNARQRAWGGWLVVGLLSCPSAGARDKPARTTPRKMADQEAEDHVRATLPRARVWLEDEARGALAVDVEVAATPDSRSRGLMWRKELHAGQGMLFVFADEEIQRFWMRNTLIPLDMIFINSRGRIVGLVENAAPRSLLQRFVREPGRYVLEVPGGWSRTVGLALARPVRFEGLEHIPVIP
jgi:uncharacterized protein